VHPDPPEHIDLEKDRGLTVRWADGTRSYYPIAHLRRLSPSADQRELRKQMTRNPLTVLPGGSSGAVRAESAELVGNYAIRIAFSDGHGTGLFSWKYLREIDPDRMDDPGRAPGDDGPRHDDPLGLG